ncbi:MAG: hypothetical protein SOZ60_08065, partial [Prevotella sp.]|nr:hypothetical protein [Prevotella sp.]
CKALRGQMQSFAWAIAKLCVGNCKALRWQLQSFAWADAKLCVKKGLIVDEIDDSSADKGFP